MVCSSERPFSPYVNEALMIFCQSILRFFFRLESHPHQIVGFQWISKTLAKILKEFIHAWREGSPQGCIDISYLPKDKFTCSVNYNSCENIRDRHRDKKNHIKLANAVTYTQMVFFKLDTISIFMAQRTK